MIAIGISVFSAARAAPPMCMGAPRRSDLESGRQISRNYRKRSWPAESQTLVAAVQELGIYEFNDGGRAWQLRYRHGTDVTLARNAAPAPRRSP